VNGPGNTASSRNTRRSGSESYYPRYQAGIVWCRGEARIGLAGALGEQCLCLRLACCLVRAGAGKPERGQPVLPLPADTEWLPAGRQDAHLIAAGQQGLSEIGDRWQDMLAVVQDEQQPAWCQRFREHLELGPASDLLHSQGRHYLGRNLSAVRDGAQPDEPDSVGELALYAPGYLARQPGLAHTAGAGHGHQASAVDQPYQRVNVRRAANEARQRHPDCWNAHRRCSTPG
jgi:hypothetical protein